MAKRPSKKIADKTKINVCALFYNACAQSNGFICSIKSDELNFWKQQIAKIISEAGGKITSEESMNSKYSIKIIIPVKAADSLFQALSKPISGKGFYSLMPFHQLMLEDHPNLPPAP